MIFRLLTNMETQHTPNSKKPIKTKPHFYAHCYAGLQAIAKEHGYNLLLHGSLNRDLDLVAVPWIDAPAEHMTLITAFCEYLGVFAADSPKDFGYSVLPGGRHSYVINLNRGGKFNGYLDEEYYLDISITPLQLAIK